MGKFNLIDTLETNIVEHKQCVSRFQKWVLDTRDELGGEDVVVAELSKNGLYARFSPVGYKCVDVKHQDRTENNSPNWAWMVLVSEGTGQIQFANRFYKRLLEIQWSSKNAFSEKRVASPTPELLALYLTHPAMWKEEEQLKLKKSKLKDKKRWWKSWLINR